MSRLDPESALAPERHARRLPHEETLAGYDRWSQTYDATKNPMVAATAFALERWPFEVAAEDVVELGCGTGRHVEAILRAGARSYTGVDGSAGMLEVASRCVRDPRVRWVRAPLQALPDADHSFGAALLVLVLEHLEDLHAAFLEIARVLRPGGRLRVLEIHSDLLLTGTNAHFEDDGVEVRFASFCHTGDEIATALSAVGFEILERRELAAEAELLQRAPKLAKHGARRILIDLEARKRLAR
ncbi:MAG: class I SAM-dependent methyltransferase [Planctomycetes bacterium]|nr:class I SAM-dependent methyltransferase [Planctomycetota bacterium]